MKIQLDTTAKVIKVEETVNIGELISALEKLLPKGEWKDFKLETHTTIEWSTPVVIPYRPVVQPCVPQPLYPIDPWWRQPYITCSSNSTTEPSQYSLKSGVYNIEC